MADPRPLSEKIGDNFAIMIRRSSTLVMGLLTAAAAYWLQLTPETRLALLQSYPVLLPLTPYAGAITFVVAALWPQKSVTNKIVEVVEKVQNG